MKSDHVPGLNLKSSREKLSLSQSQFSELLGLSVRQLSRLETGKAKTLPIHLLASFFLVGLATEHREVPADQNRKPIA